LLSLSLVLFCLFIAVPIFAPHGGVEHVNWNVVRVSTIVMTVKTSTGIVDVKSWTPRRRSPKDKARRPNCWDFFVSPGVTAWFVGIFRKKGTRTNLHTAVRDRDSRGKGGFTTVNKSRVVDGPQV